jgi:hypothetical protein
MVKLTDESAERPELAHINALVDAGWSAQRAQDTPRGYLGGSRLGEDCERRLGYEWHRAPEDEGKGFTGRTLRIFERGHHAEDRMARYLREAGFDLQTGDRGGQLGFGVARDRETGQARIAGHIDGKILGWEHNLWINPASGEWAAALPYPLLWEHKGLNAKNFKDLRRHGIKKSKPIYYTQVNIYMAYMDLKHAMFTAECQDTCEVYVEIVPLDIATAQAASDKGLRVVISRRPEDLPRCAANADDFRCRFCPFAGTCWAEPTTCAPEGAVVAPAWLSALKPDGT